MADFNSGRIWAAWASLGPSSSQEGLDKTEKKCDEWRDKGLCATDIIGGWPGGFQYFDLKTAKDDSCGMMRITDARLRNIFEEHQRKAHEESKKFDNKQFNVDPYLHMGGLMNKVCGYAIEAATRQYIFPRSENVMDLWKKYRIDYIAIHYAYARTYLYWSKENVKEFVKNAKWEDAEKLLKSNNASMSILYSAKNFLEACADAELGIRFSAQ